MDKPNRDNFIAIEQLKKLVARTDYRTQPFLYYLPKLLESKALAGINPQQAVLFVEIAFKHETMPYVTDAMQILNKLVSSDGTLNQPAQDMFYDNRNFFWTELGTHKTARDVILHVFNKTIFRLSVGH